MIQLKGTINFIFQSDKLATVSKPLQSDEIGNMQHNAVASMTGSSKSYSKTREFTLTPKSKN